MDHYSRRLMGFAVFSKQPTSLQVRSFLGRTMGESATPKYLMCDQGPQFFCDGFKDWCKHKGVTPRYGAVGQFGSIAIIERFFRSLKDEWLRRIMIPFTRDGMRRQLRLYASWYGEDRPHQSLGGKTPEEVYTGRKAANEKSRWEPRVGWPSDSPCAQPRTEVRDPKGSRLALVLRFHGGHRELPIVELKQAA